MICIQEMASKLSYWLAIMYVFSGDHSYQTNRITDFTTLVMKWFICCCLLHLYLFLLICKKCQAIAATLKDNSNVNQTPMSKRFRIVVTIGAFIEIIQITWVTTLIVTPNYTYVSRVTGLPVSTNSAFSILYHS